MRLPPVLRAYLRSPAGVIGLVLLLAVLAMAATADLFFPRDPLSLAGRSAVQGSSRLQRFQPDDLTRERRRYRVPRSFS